ncbi:DUF5704 domain-containing protein [Paenibacillus sp. LS1]|uniref:DUF5704 domain-containing protein n=1 Tax=Paenibacillus sp. LS1 TaxID=2992120 RepID=UPI0022311EA1|nr:DUF5704 domain-containing protein [Paenibacillus sp. LS1]MCW3793932.1 DUF5704 domain-containing protein [Paenibacillus sp. LS1]
MTKSNMRFLFVIVSIALIMELMVGLLPLGKVSAADDPISIPYENISYGPDGMIRFTTVSTEATSSIKYKTVGFTITRNARCTSTDCAPQSGGSFGEVRIEQDGPGVSLPGGKVRTAFKIPAEKVNDALEDAGLGSMEGSGQIWLSAIFRVMHGANEVNRDHKTLQSIKNAEGWADPGGFRQYYDIPLVVNPYYPVTKIYRTVDAEEILTEKVDNPGQLPDKNWPLGKPVRVILDKKTPFNGGEYVLVKSYIQSKRKLNEQNFVQTGQADPDSGTDTSLNSRNFTNYLGGTNVVGVYRKVSGCTIDPSTGECEVPSCATDPNRPECQPITVGCTPPSKGTTIQSPATAMNPRTSAVIKADNRGAEKFDVSKGIPTSETLFGQVNALNYLFKNEFANYTGSCTYKVTVTKLYIKVKQIPAVPGTGPNNPGTPAREERTPEPVTKEIEVKRNYSYWQVDNLEVYKIKEANLSNYALPNGSVKLTPNGYTPPFVSVTNSTELREHIVDPPLPTVNLGSQEVGETVPDESGLFKSAAEAQTGKIKVKNDTLVFENSRVMDGSYYEETGPTPGTIPASTMINQNVLYGKDYLISNTLINKADTESTGDIHYEVITPGNINGGSPQKFDINGINTVTVHTPVVIYASTSDDRAHNQKTIPATARNSTILDRPFTVSMPTNGQHRNILGYGNRDYAKYVRDKQVYFPFDVYSGDKSKFYPKGTWISIPVAQETQTFFLPVWVDEGYYDVLFRTIAENAPSNFTTESQANLNLANHVATDSVPIDVVGRVYDFHVTDIADFNWETFFRKAKGSSTPTGNSFWVGGKGIDGANRTSANNFVLPVRQGSNPIKGLQNITVKTGYTFKFDLKTKGNMFDDKDGVRVTPEFYFVSRDGKNRRLVDLYYHSDKAKFIKVGTTADVEKRNVTLNSRLRNVPQQSIVNTSSTLWEMFASSRGWSTPKQKYMQDYLKNTSKATYVGGYDVQILTAPLRTFIGTMNNLPGGVDIYKANASVQQWYGEYSLPAAVYAVPRGTNLASYGGKLDDKSKVFLKDGYIVVNFTVDTIRNGDTSKPHLQYIRRPGSSFYGTYNNQWRDMEGFSSSFTTPYGVNFSSIDGDVMYYDANKSSYDDFNSSGTH